MQAWIAEQVDDSEVCDAPQEDLEVAKGAGDSVACDTAPEQNVTTSRLEKQHDALKKSIEELSKQRQLEMANYKLQLQKEKQIFELEKTMLENELMLKREQHRMEEDSKKVQAEIHSTYENTQHQLEAERFGPTTHPSTPLYIQGRLQVSSKVLQTQSTPGESQKNP